jgi:hypothetical protein
MKRLSVDKLHVRYLPGTGHDSPVMPRRYTLTHSDLSGDLYLTVGANYDQAQVSGWYTKLMRDEVLAEWEVRQGQVALLVHCHVSGGFVIGWAGLRDAIFRRELPLVLEALRFGDRALFDAHTELDHAPIWVHFHAKQPRYNVVESWGTPADYRE